MKLMTRRTRLISTLIAYGEYDVARRAETFSDGELSRVGGLLEDQRGVKLRFWVPTPLSG